jgi:hypothetical protein
MEDKGLSDGLVESLVESLVDKRESLAKIEIETHH